MKIIPALEQVRDIAAQGAYDIVPLSCEILSDFITPIEAMRILKAVSTHCYMLESAQANDRWGRYTFLGFDPVMAITCIDGEMKAGGEQLHTDDPSAYLRKLLSKLRSPRFDYLPSFTGGLVGYFSYDYLGYSEPRVRCRAEDSEAFKDVDLMLFDKVIAFDNVRQKIILIANMKLDDLEEGYRRAAASLRELADLLRNGKKSREKSGRLLGEVTPLFSREQYCAMVERAKRHIREGDIFQIVLSNRLSAPFEGSLLNTYRVLRTINPSPYMFYFSGTDVEVAGASPETLVKLEKSCSPTKRSLPSTICWWIWDATIWARSAASAPWRWRSSAALSGSPMSCTSAPPCAARSAPTRTPLTPLRRCSLRARSRERRRSAPAS